MQILGTSALLGTIVAFALVGCGGGESPKGETPKAPTATTQAPAGQQPTTATTAAPGEKAAEDEDEDLAAPLLVWADSDTDEGKAPLTIQFKADVEGGTPPLTYSWKFGDDSSAAEANPKHTFQKAGKYRVDLEVKDSGGDQDSDYLEIEVTE